MDPKSKMIRDVEVLYDFSDDLVLSAMEKVPRHKFVDIDENSAYSDGPISIGYGQTMSQPYTVAYMTHLLISTGKSLSTRKKEQEKANWRVLEIGTGSGYQAAVLAELFGQVYTIEIIPELAEKARKNLKRLGYKNVHVKKGSGEWGWKEHSPYDGIMITAAVEKDIPRDLKDQLKIGGVIVTPIGPRNLQTMMRFTKVSEDELKKEKFEKFVFVPFIEEN